MIWKLYSTFNLNIEHIILDSRITKGSIVSDYFDLKILSLTCCTISLVQLFGLNYQGIMDSTDLEWYTAIFEEYKSLDINDFLHNISVYVVNYPLPS